MKKILAIAAIALACNSALAQHNHGSDVGVAIGIGILTGVLIANSNRQHTHQEVVREVIVHQPIVQAAPAYPIHAPRHRPIYRAVDVFIPECGCTRTIMVPIR